MITLLKIFSVLFFVTHLNASILQVLDSNNHINAIEELGLAGLKDTVESVDSKDAGTWYLQKARWGKFKQVRDDEFNYDAAVNESYNMLLKEIEKSQSILNETFYVDTITYFGEYDFNKEQFNVSVDNRFIFTNYAQKFVEKDRALDMTFANLSRKSIFFKIDKNKAKEFINSRKDKNGKIDRQLNVRYLFKIKSVKSPVKYSLQGCYKKTCSSIKWLKTVVELKTINIMDNQKNNLFSYKADTIESDSELTQKPIDKHEVLAKYYGNIDKFKVETTFYLKNNQLLGKYDVYENPHCLGELYNAKIEGNSITFDWKDKYGVGKAVFHFNNSKEYFKGTWGNNLNSSGVGYWNGKR